MTNPKSLVAHIYKVDTLVNVTFLMHEKGQGRVSYGMGYGRQRINLVEDTYGYLGMEQLLIFFETHD